MDPSQQGLKSTLHHSQGRSFLPGYGASIITEARGLCGAATLLRTDGTLGTGHHVCGCIQLRTSQSTGKKLSEKNQAHLLALDHVDVLTSQQATLPWGTAQGSSQQLTGKPLKSITP